MTFTRSARALLVSGALFALAGCSNYTTRALTAQVGVDTGVALTTAGSVTSLLTSQTLALGATVENASNVAGVNWSVSGVGTLTSITSTTATYVAPSSVTGSATALITATSIANPTKSASVALIVLGTPVIPSTTLFPGNVNVPYQAPVTAAGGDAPFSWVVATGSTLPAGLALNGSTSAATYITGTPTSAGSYSFTLQTTDTESRVATVALTMVIKPQAACVLSGSYTLLFTGFRGGAAASHVASIVIDPSTGDITGEQDYKDPHRTTPAEALTSGTCTNRETNTGVLTLNAPSGQLVYNFAATPPASAGVDPDSAELELISSGSDSGSGQLLRQNLSGAPTTPLAGNYAFGLFGADSVETHFGMAGRFTSDATGTLSAGLVDSNDTAALVNSALTGSDTAPDANGRGTLTLQAGSQTTTLAYYLINSSKMFLIDIDPTPDSTKRTIRMGGQMSAQTGDVTATTFDDGALATPSIISLMGATGALQPNTVMALGRLSNANTIGGTVDVMLDTSDLTNNTAGQLYSAQSYSVAANGRGTLTLASTGTAARSFAFYLDGTSNGYLVEQGSTSGNAGFLEAQFQGPYPEPPPTGIFPPTMQNAFVSGTAYPQASGPITLNALAYLNYDALSSNFINGSFAIDPASGRGLGTITESGVGTNSAAIYIVSPIKMDMLRFSTLQVNGTMEWMIQ